MKLSKMYALCFFSGIVCSMITTEQPRSLGMTGVLIIVIFCADAIVSAIKERP